MNVVVATTLAVLSLILIVLTIVLLIFGIMNYVELNEGDTVKLKVKEFADLYKLNPERWDIYYLKYSVHLTSIRYITRNGCGNVSITVAWYAYPRLYLYLWKVKRGIYKGKVDASKAKLISSALEDIEAMKREAAKEFEQGKDILTKMYK